MNVHMQLSRSEKSRRVVLKLEGVPVKGAPFKLVVSPGDYSVDNTHILFPEVNINGMEDFLGNSTDDARTR